MWKWIVLALFLILIAIIVWSMLRTKGGAQQVTPPEDERREVAPSGTGEAAPGAPEEPRPRQQAGGATRADTSTHRGETGRRADEPYDQTADEATAAPVEAVEEAPPEEPVIPAEPVAEAPVEPVEEAPTRHDSSAVPSATDLAGERAPAEPAPAAEPQEAAVPEEPAVPEEAAVPEEPAQAQEPIEAHGATPAQEVSAAQGDFGQRYADGSTDVTGGGTSGFAEPAGQEVQEPGRGTDTGQTPATAAQDLGDRTAPSVGMGHGERGHGEWGAPDPQAPPQETPEAPAAHAGSEGMGTSSSGGSGTYRQSVSGTQNQADLGPAGSGQINLPSTTPTTPDAGTTAPAEGRAVHDPYGNAPVEEAPPQQARYEQPPLVEEPPVEQAPVEQAPPQQARYQQPPLVEEPPVEQAPVEQMPVEHVPVEHVPADTMPPEATPTEETALPTAPAETGAIEPGPYGVGSAEPDEEGAGPVGWTVKGNAGSMLFHTEDSPSYANRADVWFQSEDAAKAAGFKHWDRKRR